MTGKLLIPAFILMVIAQWFVPARMILQLENVISGGHEFRFRTAPVDPNDPFRGKYITLSYLNNDIPVEEGVWQNGDAVYVQLKTDSAGFAIISSLSNDEPTDTDAYINAYISYVGWDSIHTAYIQYPFDRYYMEEKKAPVAEQIYNEASRNQEKVTWAVVMVDRGRAVLKDVMIDGVPIRELARKPGTTVE